MKYANVDETKKKIKQMPKFNMYEFFSAACVAFLLFMFAILTITGKDREYSEDENRMLAQSPVFSLASVIDGKFMDDMEEYLSDQFVFRDSLVRTRTNIDVFLGKREINGVYIGRKHYLYEETSVYNESRVKKTTDTMNAIRARYGDIRSYVAIAPNSSEIITDYLPSNAPVQNQTEQINQVYASLEGFTCIDLYSPLKNAEHPENLYYKTDHHWTAEAVDIAYTKIAASMQLEADSFIHSNLAVTNEFQGTLASSSGIFSACDTIYVPTCPADIMYRVTYVNEGKSCTTVFDPEKLQEKSKYDVFFGGNFAQIIIETNSTSDRVLMVVKDSYANSLIPRLIPHFKTIVIVDPRYYNDNLNQIVEREQITDILWLYNANTFLNDTSISGKLS